MQKTPKGGFSAHSGAKKAQKWGFSKKLSKNRQIKSSQVICDPKSQLFMSQFLNFQSETKIVKITHSALPPMRISTKITRILCTFYINVLAER